MRGWVYIITTKSIQSLKIGFSTKDPLLRALELSNTGNPHPYIVRYDVLVQSPRDIEQEVHRLLSSFHDRKEWFNCSLAEAITAIRKVANNILIEETYGFNSDQNSCQERDKYLLKRKEKMSKRKEKTKDTPLNKHLNNSSNKRRSTKVDHILSKYE